MTPRHTPVRLPQGDHPPGPVTIFRPLDRVSACLTAAQFRELYPTTWCLTHSTYACLECRWAARKERG